VTVPWLAQMEGRRLVLSLRELLVRLDENLAAHTLLQECVPYICDGDPEIERARQDQAAMVDHIVGDSYAHYYETNHHEKPFEEQYGISAEEAHEHLHRVRFLRAWLSEHSQRKQLRVLDLACNDGWLAENLYPIDVAYDGIDLNPHCIERAKTRETRQARFVVGFAEKAWETVEGWRPPLERGRIPGPLYDAVIAYELIEHVKDPDAVLAAMVECCRPGGSLFVSTPLGACTGGDLSDWFVVEPKGHVRAYTPQRFYDLLARHAVVDEIQVTEAQQGMLMVARATVAAIVADHAGEPVRAERAGRTGDPRTARRPRAAER
jgi:2-polyprenyl-3-methyl-5-hydroxy-6-metoxy-1,4-benzoquinol methylase